MNFTVPENTSRDTHKTRKLPLPQLEAAKKHLTQTKTSQKPKENFFDFFFQKKVSGKSHSAENPKDGTLSDFLTSILLRTIKKLKRGPFGDFKKFRKNLTMPKLHLNFEHVICEL